MVGSVLNTSLSLSLFSLCCRGDSSEPFFCIPLAWPTTRRSLLFRASSQRWSGAEPRGGGGAAIAFFRPESRRGEGGIDKALFKTHFWCSVSHSHRDSVVEPVHGTGGGRQTFLRGFGRPVGCKLGGEGGSISPPQSARSGGTSQREREQSGKRFRSVPKTRRTTQLGFLELALVTAIIMERS